MQSQRNYAIHTGDVACSDRYNVITTAHNNVCSIPHYLTSRKERESFTTAPYFLSAND